MKLTDDIMRQDIEDIADSYDINWRSFENKTILITGASGLIGRQLVFVLLRVNQVYNYNISIIAIVHSKEKARKVFGKNLNDCKLTVIEEDICGFECINGEVDYIIHGASITSSKMFVTKPVETINTNFKGCENILKIAREKKIIRGVYLSSMEIYGINSEGYLSEKDYGYIEHMNVRSSYSESKRLCECLCNAFAKEYKTPFVIARLTQTFGPGVEYSDQRVFAQFARSILEGKDIVLFSKGETVRNYCYTKDAVKAIFILLQKGEISEAYNVANEETEISIYNMAKMLLNEFGNGKQKLKIQLEDTEKYGFNPISKTCIKCDKIKKLGWKAEVGLREAYFRMMLSMKERNNNK